MIEMQLVMAFDFDKGERCWRAVCSSIDAAAHSIPSFKTNFDFVKKFLLYYNNTSFII
jgi:hypothetical protein